MGTQTKIIELRKNDFLLPPTKVEKNLYNVVSGIVWSFVENNGEFTGTWFYNSENYFSEYASFIAKERSATYSKVLRNCKNDVLQVDYKNSIEHQILGKKISEQLSIRLQKRNIYLLNLSKKSAIINSLKIDLKKLKKSLKYIASYLGMTPVSWSRIREELIS